MHALFWLVRDFFIGVCQGMVSTVLLCLPRDTWNQYFGDAQHNPLSGDDGLGFTKAKYIGRVLGAGAMPWGLVIICLALSVSL